MPMLGTDAPAPRDDKEIDVIERKGGSRPGGVAQPLETIRFSRAFRVALVAVVTLSGLAGCAGAGTSPGPKGSELSSARISTTNAATTSLSPTRRPFSFAATGSMSDPRLGATATLMQNGKVLIAGGAYGLGAEESAFNSAELYDPATGKFTPTGSMTISRVNQTATLLTDGRVLIVGGSVADCGDTNA